MRLAARRRGGILGEPVPRRRGGVAPFLEDERELVVELGEGGAQAALKPWIGAGAEVAGNAMGRPGGQLLDAVAGAKEPEGEDAYAEHHHDPCVPDAHRMPQRCDCLLLISAGRSSTCGDAPVRAPSRVSFPY